MRSSGVPGEGSTFLFSITASLAPFVAISPSSLASPRWLINTANIFILDSCYLSAEVIYSDLSLHLLLPLSFSRICPLLLFRSCLIAPLVQPFIPSFNHAHYFMQVLKKRLLGKGFLYIHIIQEQSACQAFEEIISNPP